MSNFSVERVLCPDWLVSFASRKFFDECPDHSSQPRNERNRYCVTCDASICRSCIANDHHNDGHTILSIYHYAHQDVVPLSEMESLIDCTKIQPYKLNRKQVLSLTPLPHSGSGALLEGDASCDVCRRKLMNPERFRYCSIDCQVKACNAASNDGDEAGPSRDGGCKKRRKGTPHRAPCSSV